MKLPEAAGGAGAGDSSSDILPVVAAFWKEFDLEGRRSKLDEVGLKIAEHQEQSIASRKQLADATREFKRSSAASTDDGADGAASASAAKAFAPLLKRYQAEVDGLTRRAKHGESAFLELYQLLYEAPDPAPALLLALESASRLSELGAQAAKMAGELAEYKAESKAIKNQDLTIRKLEEQTRDLTAQLEGKDAEMAAAQQKAAAEADAALIAQMQAREAELTETLASAQASLQALQRLHSSTQNQLFAMQARSEEEKASAASELELATAELERAQERLGMLEREKAALMQQRVAAETSSTQPPAGTSTTSSADSSTHTNPLFSNANSVEEGLRLELASQREVCARLRSELASAKQELEEVHGDWEARMQGVRAQLAATEQHAADVERQLASRATDVQVDELKQQIRILQAVGGYGAMEGDDGSPTHPSAAATAHGATDAAARTSGSSGAAGASLESMLLAKNRRLEHELTVGRLKVAEATQLLDAAQAQVSDLDAQLQQKQALVDRLEEDLLRSQTEAVGTPGARSASIAAPGTPGRSGWNDSGAFGDGDDDDSMVRVLSSQRDRFRQRCQELEEELARARQELQASKSDLAAARADNVALVERLRYVHGYRHQQRSQAGADIEQGAAVEARYAKEYDDGLNPFKQFQGQQREQKRKLMGVTDRAMYSMGNLVFQGPSARLLAFCYLTIMHLLVFFSLTHMTHRTGGAMMDHHEALLSTHRHDLTSMMHADGQAVAAAAASASPAVAATAGEAVHGMLRRLMFAVLPPAQLETRL